MFLVGVPLAVPIQVEPSQLLPMLTEEEEKCGVGVLAASRPRCAAETRRRGQLLTSVQERLYAAATWTDFARNVAAANAACVPALDSDAGHARGKGTRLCATGAGGSVAASVPLVL